MRNEGTTFALPAARPLRGSDDRVKLQSRWRSKNSIPYYYRRAKYIDTQIKDISFC